ncbi:fatty acyl-AMP ligase [Kutzneria buriramensis]|uniref:Acyl-CoA synthetase (AMP-forming)/AMP-acid ligase II n=1 Tax=Kutzneria buriramensis TaxID=1045776 RepID=A0A3E0IBH6_9PSEU|nr:fatty acyl-AMP ligase [Kutzneria buriramensis]REH55941.1 acyl-CoA synthetase (AMP-forming)/AMP-acid ligase II [Kutzneria buriramensis]
MTVRIDSPETVAAALDRIRREHPDQPIVTYVNDDGTDGPTLTAGQLGDQADRVVAELYARGLQPGDRALLVHMPSPDFAITLLGCLAAGVVPVPVAPPNPFTMRHDLEVFTAIAGSSGARAVLTHGAYDRIRTTVGAGQLWPSIPWYRTDRDRPGAERAATWHQPSTLDEPALLTYTSGSTSSPRGVLVSHRNLHCELAQNLIDTDLRGPETPAVSWLPHFHDQGLISMTLGALAGSGHVYLMSPMAFLHRPTVWMDVVSRVRATHTAAPNFAYDLIVRKTTEQQRASWDLSRLRVAMCAAEPIRASTVDSFVKAFAVSGLAPHAFYPAYGLAEHAGSVTMGGRHVLRVDRDALDGNWVVPVAEGSVARSARYVGCGPVTKPDTTLLIVDPDRRLPCAPNRVGEIWVDGPGKALGYYGLPDETRDTFRATLADDSDGEFLRTGDLGFVHDGEVFVTGRLKDLIIVHGLNHYPQDIEDSVRGCHAAVRAGGVAAFAVTTGEDEPTGERLVLFVELRQRRPNEATIDEVVRAVRRAVYGDHRLAVHTVVLGLNGLVRKTTSGKVRRQACREAFESGLTHGEPTTVHVSTLH